VYLITSAAWASGRVSDSVVEQLRGNGEPVRVIVARNDGRANRFRELGAEVVVAVLVQRHRH
jgi:NAD(P)H dehydrogenase (quinone)